MTGARRCGSQPVRSKRDAVGRDLDARPQPHGLVRVAVDVDRALGLVDAVRQGRELGARAPLGVVEQLAHRAGDRLAAVPRDERLQPPDAGRVRRDLGAEVAGRLVLGADLREDQREDVAHDPPASTTLTGGMITPSWNTSRNAPIEAGAPPPTSTWWARFAT